MEKETNEKPAVQENAGVEKERKPTNKERFNSMMMAKMEGYNPEEYESS